jgi:(p)ppGpp synthase/HD superfamily hydrolase
MLTQETKARQLVVKKFIHESYKAVNKLTSFLPIAGDFALYAHAQLLQRRKYDGSPYIVHPVRVWLLLKEYNITDPDILDAALLHDVFEDCDVPGKLIANMFGKNTEQLVGWLTDISCPEDGNRNVRKQIDREFIAKAPQEAKTIKVADLIDNTQSIVTENINFAKIYIPEKKLLLDVLKEADDRLLNRAWQCIEKAEEVLKGQLDPEDFDCC